ncbi:MAG: hypothetical protein FJW31_31365 [Acidobacteria bacterium]|nr:hypothetical protein [Acidobacteriota bacterium]
MCVAIFIALDLAAANARDLPVNTWFWDLGQKQGWVLALAEFFSWFADGPRNIVIAPLVAVIPVVALGGLSSCLVATRAGDLEHFEVFDSAGATAVH